MPRISERMEQLLIWLSEYHYLTTPQLTELFYPEAIGLKGKDFERKQKKVRDLLAGVSEETSSIAFGAYCNHHPNIWYLNARGARTVQEIRRGDPVFFPKVGELKLSSDAPHRSQVIGFRLMLDRHAAATGAEVEFFHPYYRCMGANHSLNKQDRLRKLTRIDFPGEAREQAGKQMFWADAAFLLRHAKGKMLALVEVHRGSDTGRIEKQLELHLIAMEHGLPADKYGLKQANMVLLVFDDDAAMGNFLKRLQLREDFEEFARFIACSTGPRLKVNFHDWFYCWQNNVIPGGLY